jgi:hypothetical protein
MCFLRRILPVSVGADPGWGWLASLPTRQTFAELPSAQPRSVIRPTVHPGFVLGATYPHCRSASFS